MIEDLISRSTWMWRNDWRASVLGIIVNNAYEEREPYEDNIEYRG